MLVLKFHPGMKCLRVFFHFFHPGMKFHLGKNVETVRVRLHVTELKSHTGMKKFLFTREFHPGMKREEPHPGMKFNLKGKLPLSMKTYKIYHLNLIC